MEGKGREGEEMKIKIKIGLEVLYCNEQVRSSRPVRIEVADG